MDKDVLKKDIESMVAEIFSEKEDVAKKRLTEEALEKSAKVVTELTDSVVEKDSMITDLETKISDVKGILTENSEAIEAEKAKVVELEKQLEEATTKLSASELQVIEMEKDMAADVRIVELKDSKVNSTDQPTQFKKVREMSDDEFASYKKELIDLRKSITEELASGENSGVSDDSTNSDGSTVTPDMDIDSKNSEQAALNLEADTNDVVSDYTDLGKAMAAAWVTDKS